MSTNFTDKQLEQINLGVKNGLNIKQVERYWDDMYTHYQMEQIRLGYENGLTDDQVQVYANPKLGPNVMEQIRLGYENGLTDKQVKMYAQLDLHSKQIKQIRLGYEYGLTDEQVLVFAEVYTHDDMFDYIKKAYKEGLTIEKAKEIASFYTYDRHTDKSTKEMICKCLHKGLDKSIIDRLMGIFYHCEEYWDEYKFGNAYNEYFYDSLFQPCLELYLNGATKEEMDLLLINSLSHDQIKEIQLGMSGGLAYEQVKVYANPKIPAEKMKQIREILVEAKTV